MTRRIVVLALVLLAACTGSPRPDGQAATPAPGAFASAIPKVRVGRPTRAPDAQATIGTLPQVGLLTEWCRDGACERTTASPERFVKAPPDERLVVFALEKRPERIAVVARTVRGRVLDRTDLRAGTHTPVYTADVPAGRTVLELEAIWGKQRARWTFAIRFAEAG